MTSPFPDVVRIEPAGSCNFTCRHCPVGLTRNKRPSLVFPDFVKVFDSLPAVPRVMVFYHGGEPLLNWRVEAMVKYAKNRGVQKAVMNCNASLLSKPRAEALAQAGLDELRISFDGVTAEENNRVRVGSNFDRDAQKVLEASRLLNVVIYNVQFSEHPEPPDYLTETFGDKVKYRSERARVWAALSGAEIVNPIRYCPELWETFSILSNGDVVMCCEDLLGQEILGNVFTQAPLDIWRGKANEVRSAFMRREWPQLCRKCYRLTGAFQNSVTELWNEL